MICFEDIELPVGGDDAGNGGWVFGDDGATGD